MSIDQFREILTTQFFPAENLPFEADSAAYERLIDSYAFDGLSLGKIQNWVEANQGARKSGPFQPRPEEVHVKYRFNKASKEYTVDAEGNLDADGPFTPLGHAVARNLHLGRKVTFEEGDEVTIDQLSAEGYQRDGTTIAPFPQTESVTEIDRIYVRKYRDYPFMFSSSQSQAAKLRETLEGRKRDNATHDNAIAKNLDEQIQERTRIKADLEFDIANLEKDRDVIAAAESKRAAEVEQLQKQVEQLLNQKIWLRRQVGSAAARIVNRTQNTELSVSTDGGFTRSVPAIDNVTLPVYGQPVYSEPVFSQPIYDAPVYVEPVYGAPIEQRSIPINEPIYSQPREFESQPAPIEILPSDASSQPRALNFTDQVEPRDATGTRTTQPLDSVIEPLEEESALDFFEDVN